MPVLDRSKVRPDILEMLRESQKVQIQAIFKYVRENKDPNINFEELFKRVANINENYFKGRIKEEEILNALTMDEMVYFAKVLRYMFDFTADIRHKNNPLLEGLIIEKFEADGVPAEWQYFEGAVEDKVILFLHGGGYILGSPKSHLLLTAKLAQLTNLRVLSLDYRLAPEDPHPASLEDSTTAYKWLLSKGFNSKKIIISGDSAGGNLTLATLLNLKSKGIELPAAAIPLSPLVDYTLSDPSFMRNSGTDPILAEIGVFWWLTAYVADNERSNPLISPLFGDLKGLPPLLFQASSSEMLYSDSVRFVEKAKIAGVDATLQVWDDMPHVFQLFGISNLPESLEAIAKIGEFIKKILI